MVKPGDIIKDNDPRSNGRTLVVLEIDEKNARAVCTNRDGRRTKIVLASIHTDDKPRRSGYSKIPR